MNKALSAPIISSELQALFGHPYPHLFIFIGITMAICFVIQPFDSGKFDKRFEDVYKPAIEAAGLEAYRVDRDPSVSVPITSIEDGIKRSLICLADITSDNPNVWYELGYAFASGQPVVMVCSQERTGNKYPFDIQHRSIIPYHADAPSDFDKLRHNLTEKIKALIETGSNLQSISKIGPMAPVEGLGQVEILVLAIVAGSGITATAPIDIFNAKRDAERGGISSLGFNLGFRRLQQKGLARLLDLQNDQTGEEFEAVQITDKGWEWIDNNDSLFTLLYRPNDSDDLPF